MGEFLTRYGTDVRAQAKLAVDGVAARLSAVEAALEAEAEAERLARTTGEELERLTEIADVAGDYVGELEGTLQGLKDSDAYRSRLELEDLRGSVASAEEQANVPLRRLAPRPKSLRRPIPKSVNSPSRPRPPPPRWNWSGETAGFAERGGIEWSFTEVTAAAAHRGRQPVRNAARTSARSPRPARHWMRRPRSEGRTRSGPRPPETNLEAAAAALTDAHEAVGAQREALERSMDDWAREHRSALKLDLREEALAWAAEADAESAPHLRERATERTLAAPSAIEQRLHQLKTRLGGVTGTIGSKRVEWKHRSATNTTTRPLRRIGAISIATDWPACCCGDGCGSRPPSTTATPRPSKPRWKRRASSTPGSATSQTRRTMRSGRCRDRHGRMGPRSPSTWSARTRRRDLPVQDLLESIAVRPLGSGEGAAYSIVDLSGRFAHGAVAGRAGKPAPEFIGATARQRRRERRMRELEAQIEALQTEAREIQNALDDCDAELRSLEEALRAVPRAAGLVRALHNVTTRELFRAERAGDLEKARAALEQAVARQHGAAQRLQEVERRHELARGDLESVRRAVVDFEGAVRDLRFAMQRHADLGQRLEQQRERAQRLVPLVQSMETKARAADDEHRRLRSRLDSIERSLDADTASVFEQIAALDGELKQARLAAQEAGRRREAGVGAKSAAGADARAAAERTVGAIGEARVASVALRPFCDDDLLGILGCPTGHRWPETDAVPEKGVLPAAVAAIFADLRSATSEVQATENSAKAATTIVTTRLQEVMAQLPATGLDHHLSWNNASGIIKVEVDTDEGRQAVGSYGRWLHEQREEQGQLLTEKEQHVLEDALLTALTGQIHQRVLESRDLVDQMDLAMRERRTSSGLRLGVSWLLKDFEPAERELFSLFNAAPAKLSTMMPQIRKYFADRIKQERARRRSETTYRDLLAEILDYRRWRKFEFTLLRPDGQKQRLTKRVHSQLSGGEQSVALHLPLFAAANAVFGSAAAHAPRMVGLDEAFAGVDEKGRGELMSLAAEFDLQMVMTGYDLWATFPEVEGAAHYSLSHDEATATVSAMLMVWNGSENTESHDYDGSLAAALGSPGTRMVPYGA